MDPPDNFQSNLNHFSKELTHDLKSILESQFNAKLSDEKVQEVGVRILFFVISRESLKQEKTVQTS